MLRRQWRVIAGTVLTFMGMAGAALALIPPSFTATAWLYFDPAPQDILDLHDHPAPSPNDTARIESEVDLIGSQRTLIATVRDLGLAKAGRSSLALREQVAVDWLDKRVSVQRRGLTYLISVKARSSNPNEAARLANGVASAYLRSQVGGKVDDVLRDLAAVRERLVVAGRELTEMLRVRETQPVPLFELQQKVNAARSQYDLLLRTIATLEDQAYLQRPTSRIAAPATPPTTSAMPSLSLGLGLAAGLGLVIGLLLAVARERLTMGFVDEQEAARTLDLPLVQGVPRQKPPRSSDGELPLSPADQIAQAPLGAFSESLRRVRAATDRPRLKQDGARSGRVIMVTSALSGEGKTTIAMSLARSYALAGYATLLIDCDLRNPSVHKHLGLEPSEGLIDYLRDPTDPRQPRMMLTSDLSSGARVALGGSGAHGATDSLIASPAFALLMEAAKENFDVVILDTPPVETVVDSLYLVPFADVIALVLRYRTLPKGTAAHALAALNAVRQPHSELFGVLNQHPDAAIANRYRPTPAGRESAVYPRSH